VKQGSEHQEESCFAEAINATAFKDTTHDTHQERELLGMRFSQLSRDCLKNTFFASALRQRERK
jgi:hypothetical protein